MSMCCVRNVDCSKGLSCDQKIIELDRTRAANDPLVFQIFTITEKDPTRAFSWLKVPSVFDVKVLVGTLNQEKALVGAFSVITNLRMDLRFKLYLQSIVWVS